MLHAQVTSHKSCPQKCSSAFVKGAFIKGGICCLQSRFSNFLFQAGTCMGISEPMDTCTSSSSHITHQVQGLIFSYWSLFNIYDFPALPSFRMLDGSSVSDPLLVIFVQPLCCFCRLLSSHFCRSQRASPFTFCNLPICILTFVTAIILPTLFDIGTYWGWILWIGKRGGEVSKLISFNNCHSWGYSSCRPDWDVIRFPVSLY